MRGTLPGLHELALGGTAVGTGLNTDPRFAETAAEQISRLTGKPFRPAGNFFAALSAHDAVVNASAALRTLAGALMKIANDVRWYASGPRNGIGELRIPENEPGSSIMPGKVNPTQAEALTQVAVRVFGNDAAVAFAGSQGNFQLNVYKPVMLHALLESAQLLAESARAFDAFCARGIEPDREVIGRHLEASLMLVTALTPHIGYEKAAQIAQAAHHEGLTLKEAAVGLGYVTAEEFDAWVRPRGHDAPAGRVSAKSRPERRRDTRTATRKAGTRARPAAPRRPAAKPPATGARRRLPEHADRRPVRRAAGDDRGVRVRGPARRRLTAGRSVAGSGATGRRPPPQRFVRLCGSMSPRAAWAARASSRSCSRPTANTRYRCALAGTNSRMPPSSCSSMRSVAGS